MTAVKQLATRPLRFTGNVHGVSETCHRDALLPLRGWSAKNRFCSLQETKNWDIYIYICIQYTCVYIITIYIHNCIYTYIQYAFTQYTYIFIYIIHIYMYTYTYTYNIHIYIRHIHIERTVWHVGVSKNWDIHITLPSNPGKNNECGGCTIYSMIDAPNCCCVETFWIRFPTDFHQISKDHDSEDERCTYGGFLK